MTRKINGNFPFQQRAGDNKVAPLVHLEQASIQVNYESMCAILGYEASKVSTPPYTQLVKELILLVELKGI